MGAARGCVIGYDNHRARFGAQFQRHLDGAQIIRVLAGSGNVLPAIQHIVAEVVHRCKNNRHSGENLIAGIDKVPEDIRTAVRNNGGGAVNGLSGPNERGVVKSDIASPKLPYSECLPSR